MKWYRGSRRTAIGIDPSGCCVTAVQLARAQRVWRVEAAASIPRIDPGGALDARDTSRLAGVLHRQGFRGRDVVLPMPDRCVLSGVLHFPPSTRAAAIPSEAHDRLAQAHKCEPEALQVESWSLPRPARAREGTWAYAVGCRRNEANQFIDLFESAGMTVRAIDVQSWAAVRACRPRLAGPSRLAVLLKLGWSAAHLVTLCRGLVVHERSLPDAGLDRLHGQMTETLRLEPQVIDHIVSEVGLRPIGVGTEAPSDLLRVLRGYMARYAETLASEVERSASYATQEYGEAAVGRLLLHGEGAAIPGLAEALSSALGTEVSAVSAADVADCPGPLAGVCASPALVTALGLAQHPGR